jgi:hypothetical protein
MYKKNIITISGTNGIQFPITSMEYRDNGDRILPVIYITVEEEYIKNNRFKKEEHITIYNNREELFTGSYKGIECIIYPKQLFRELIIMVDDLRIYGYRMMSCCGVKQLVRRKIPYKKYITITTPYEEQHSPPPVIIPNPITPDNKKMLKEMAAAIRSVMQTYQWKKIKERLIAMGLFITLSDLIEWFIVRCLLILYTPYIDPAPK